MKRKPTPPPRAPSCKGIKRVGTKSQLRKQSLKLHVTATRAIKWKCRNCTNNDRIEVRDCRIMTCSLWPLRPCAKVTPVELHAWEMKFVDDPLNAEILGASQMEKLEEVENITFE